MQRILSGLVLLAALLMGSGHWDAHPQRVTLHFGHTAGLGDGGCFSALSWAASGGAVCTSTANTLAPIALAGRPRVKSIVCVLHTAVATHDPTEVVTMTPVWVQADGAGSLNTTDADVTVVFNDGDDEVGDTKSNFTESSSSPYTGAQGMWLRNNITGTITTGAMTCQVLVSADN